MYIEEPKRRIEWGNIIKKGLIILLIAGIIFLIIWLFARNNSNSINVNYGDEEIRETINKDSYSESFINNYRYFHDTAKDYFLISELPKDGKTLKYTLQQFIDKKLILPMNYENSTCDTEASYATVTNNNGEYTMIITLACGNEIATTKEELGCNQLCENGLCTLKTDTTIYQYKQAYKATETVYTCPSGYTKTGTGANTKCVQNSSIVNAIKNTTYNCPNGYTKTGIGENAKCTINASKTEDAKVTTTYTCPDGYTKTGTGEETKCTITNNTTEDAKASTTYTCPNGSKPNSNNKCAVTSTVYKDAISNISYKCPSDYTKSGSSCIKYIYTKISYGTSYNGCTGGQMVTVPCSSGNCTQTRYVYKCSKGVDKNVTYTCENGKKPNSNNKCPVSTTTYVSATANTTYSCTTGTLDGTKCKIETTKTIKPDVKKEYYCNKDYKLDGTKCTYIETNTKKAVKTTNYTCPTDYTKVGIGETSTCTKGSTTTINPTKSTKTVTKYKYTCSSKTSLEGWEKTGKTCKSEN